MLLLTLLNRSFEVFEKSRRGLTLRPINFEAKYEATLNFFLYLVEPGPVGHRVSVPGVRRGGAGVALGGTPTLLLDPGTPVGVDLVAHGVGTADGEVALGALQEK